MRKSLCLVLIGLSLVAASCDPRQDNGVGLSPSMADANSNLAIPRDKDGVQLQCLPDTARQVQASDPSLAGKLVSNVVKGTLDGVTAPYIALAGSVALTPTHMLNASAPLYNASKGKRFDEAMPYCGNWCGPNHPQDVKSNPKPTDVLDNACRSHDLCYAERGDYDCGCDEQLVKTVLSGRNLFDVTPNEQIIVAMFRSSPCYGGCKTFEGHRICGGRHIPILGIKRQ